MPAVALFRGPFHVMEYADPQVLVLGGRDGRGAPVREMYAEAQWAEVQATMDEVYRSGELIMLDRPLGTLVLGPRIDDHGRVFGVASWFQPSPQLVGARPLASLPEPELLEDRAG